MTDCSAKSVKSS